MTAMFHLDDAPPAHPPTTDDRDHHRGLAWCHRGSGNEVIKLKCLEMGSYYWIIHQTSYKKSTFLQSFRIERPKGISQTKLRA